MKKVTQSQVIFYRLYKARSEDATQYIPIWQLMGEYFIPELKKWYFVSYEVSARMSELFKNNPNLFEIKKVVGKSGAKYNAYRIRYEVLPGDIIEPELIRFYKLIKSREQAIFVPNIPANK